MVDSAETDLSKVHHLVVLIHGLWGQPSHLEHLRDTLQAKHGDSGVYILVPKGNANYFTYDGIEVGGERVTHEIETTLRELADAGSKVTKISITGYSLGGLIGRYVVGLLYQDGVFDTITPTNFTTFATPHLGTRSPSTSYGARTVNFLGANVLSTSGQQLFLVDKFRDTGRPLLSVLADPASIFVKGLKCFRHRSLYANTHNDRSVPYYTAAISAYDEFVDPEAIDVHFLPNQSQDVLLDPLNPVTPRTSEAIQKEKDRIQRLPWRERFAISPETLRFYGLFLTVFPLALPVFLVNAAIQTGRSGRRIKLHEGGSLVDLKRYRLPLLLQEAQAMEDRAVERLAGQTREDYLPTPPPEPADDQSLKKTTASSSSSSKAEKNALPWPKLALTQEQFGMIDSLDEHVGFDKFYAHITKVRHTHAAIVVRVNKPTFDEGRAVSQHWVESFEV